MSLYDAILTGTFLPILGLLIVSKAHSYLGCILVSGVGVFFSLLGTVVTLLGEKQAQGMEWNFLGLAAVYLGVIAYSVYAVKKARVPQAERMRIIRRQHTHDCDVVLPAAGCRHPGTCWYCGKPGAPLRRFRLARSIVLMVVIAGESVEAMVPLCAEHPDDIHQFPNLVRMLAGPCAFFLLILPLVVMGDSFERHSELFRRGVMAGSLFASIGAYLYVRRWANETQGFRLRSINGNADIMVVRFSEIEMAQAVRKDVERLSQTPGGPNAEPAPEPRPLS